jgi:uncharacterized membrane protein YgcG
MTASREHPAAGGDRGTTLAELDLALDELAAGREVPAAYGEAGALATLAAELHVAVPPPPPGAAERGRAELLALAAGAAEGGRVERRVLAAGGRRPGRPGRRGAGVGRRSLPARVVALAAAIVLLVAVPAAVARQARPGTALWPLRQAGQQVRIAMAGDPVHQAQLRLDAAGAFLAAGQGAGEERREELAEVARERIEAVLDSLDDLAGPAAAAERARAERLLLEARALKDLDDPADRSGQGSGEDRSGRGGGAGGEGGGSGPGSGSSGPGGTRSGGSGGPDDG